MKKSLIALAVVGFAGAGMTGFSSVAMAQSSVTLYGVADAGIARTQARDPLTGKKVNSTHFMSSETMNNGTSRFGLRGVEDLGSGLKVGFNFEAGLSLADGSTNQSGGNFFSRAANVSLGGNWGEVVLGRQLTPSFWGAAAWELTGFANYSVVAANYDWGADDHRHSSMFVYNTPNLSGFAASVGYILKDDARDSGYPGAKWDANVTYKNGPIGVGLSVNKAKDEKTGYALGGKYKLGDFTVAASYNNAYAYDYFNAIRVRRRGFSLGGNYTTGPFSVTLDLTRDHRYRATDLITGLHADIKKQTNGLLEGKYALSKRTFVYAAYLRMDKTNNFGLGVRHNF